ncbi:hypothetical protein P4159_29620 [Bacillus thuringiensis]|uniref:hypothetical protein n=1 Tax=Bacillus thuringiensis TaxID=1428 RepID=UPI000CD7EF29|nr:hypothetical protein [Bacillus thuringiensis]MEC3596994.1 hypothetical protein [Bacillus thuringiensis]MED1833352.1 hypothetical protein [Bacillus thuringiensis]MED2670293.1 hypothetical protein [Bacillus thuringiensis]MED2717181.1 hypothetical protein [Bacillus thuringiensis]
MAFLTNNKAQGKRYFYIEKYVGGKPIDCRQSERVYSIGNQRIAFERLNLWVIDNRFIPKEVIDLGITMNDIETWREKVENIIERYDL